MFRATKLTGVYLVPEVRLALGRAAERNNVTISEYLRAIIIDALVEEGFDFSHVQRQRAQGCPKAGEAGQTRGDTA